MPKRSNPFGEVSPLQFKTHVGKKEVDMGVAQEERMKSVYQKTHDLLFKGSQKAFAGDAFLLDANCNNMTWEVSAQSADSMRHVPGQMCLDSRGQLTRAEIPTEKEAPEDNNVEMEESTSESVPCLPQPNLRQTVQLRLDQKGQLTAATGTPAAAVPGLYRAEPRPPVRFVTS